MVDTDIKIIEQKPIEGIKDLIVGLPDVGLVGLITVNHIIQSMKMEEIGFVESDILPPVIVVHSGLPKASIRLYGKGDVSILTSEIPLQYPVLPLLARNIVDWVKKNNLERIITITGIAVPNRVDLKKPEVYGVASSDDVRKTLSQSGIKLLEEGFMVGTHAVILKESIRKDVDNIVLMAESHRQYPDPGASASAIDALMKIKNIDVDVSKLLDQAEEIRLKMRETMQRTSKSLQGMSKEQEQELPPMYV